MAGMEGVGGQMTSKYDVSICLAKVGSSKRRRANKGAITKKKCRHSTRTHAKEKSEVQRTIKIGAPLFLR